jgi:glycosyltransferase involved in cell wall biosynthesis
MVKQPFFSIVIPTYNRASDLQFALYCLLEQTFSDFEIVISDNCSTDTTKLVVKRFNNKKILYSKTRKTLGNALNMKRAVEMARGKYVFLHSDDDFLPQKDSLQKIHNEIIKYKPGYIRVNYISLSLDKKYVFSYKVNKPFKGNEYVPPHMENKKIMTFIVDSDPYFITGVVFKNTLPKDITLIDSDPVPWIDVLFYSIKKNGAYFMNQPHIVASWSRRKIKKNTEHHIFTLPNGRLRGENYFDAVKKKIDQKDYNTFLHKELMLLYVTLFPLIKVNVGNRKMLQMAQRIRTVDSSMKTNYTYWIYLIGALVSPRIFLLYLRDFCVYLYSRVSKVDNDEKMMRILKNVEINYLQQKKYPFHQKERIFNF